MARQLTRRRFLTRAAQTAATMATATTGAGARWCLAGATGRRGLTWDEYKELDAVDVALGIQRRDFTPLDVLTVAIERASAVNGTINALVGNLDDYYSRAKRAVSRGLPEGPLSGVPFLLKDLSFYLDGAICSSGSKLFQNGKSVSNSTAVERFLRAGLVIFGRTHSPEFGILPTTESALFGITRNPWNLERTAGGSSGGSAAAVASGIAPAAAASDGGGSIRIPASCCGLFGLKPTRERVPGGLSSYGGIVSLHAITRTVRDSAALLDAARGPTPGLTNYPPKHPGAYVDEVSRAPGKLRIGMVLRNPRAGRIHADCVAAVESTGKLCESLGHHVEDTTELFAAAFSWDELIGAQVILFVSGLRDRILGYVGQIGRQLRKGDVEPATYHMLTSREYAFSGADYAGALATADAASSRLAMLMSSYDVLLTPTLGKPPIGHGVLTLQQDRLNHREFVDFVPIAFLANLTGVPAMSVPLHWNDEGLPIGVQFFGRYGDEAGLLRLAGQLEQARPWRRKRPPEKNFVG